MPPKNARPNPSQLAKKFGLGCWPNIVPADVERLLADCYRQIESRKDQRTALPQTSDLRKSAQQELNELFLVQQHLQIAYVRAEAHWRSKAHHQAWRAEVHSRFGEAVADELCTAVNKSVQDVYNTLTASTSTAKTL